MNTEVHEDFGLDASMYLYDFPSLHCFIVAQY